MPREFLQHEFYRFSVLINPTKRDSKSRKLIAVRGREAIASWFAEKSQEQWGFYVEPSGISINAIQVLSFEGKDKRRITICRVKIEGMLQVKDALKFRSSFAHGLGRARTFGCGLLQIVPAMNLVNWETLNG